MRWPFKKCEPRPRHRISEYYARQTESFLMAVEAHDAAKS